MNAKADETDALKVAQRIADLEFLITLLRQEIATLRARLGSKCVSSDSTVTANKTAEQHPRADLLRLLRLAKTEAQKPGAASL